MKKLLSTFLFVCLMNLVGLATGRADIIKLNGAGATFPYPLYSKWFSEYNKLRPDVQINYQSIGSGGGIQQIKAKTVAFGASDAPLSAEEEKAMPAPVVQVPTTAGSVVVVYNLPGVDKGLKLAPDVVADLFLGKIEKWNDPRIVSQNPGIKLPDLPVAVVHRSDGSGTTYIFSDYLSKVSPDFSSKVGKGKAVNWPAGIGGKGNEGVAGQVKQTPGAVGYVEFAYAMQNQLSYASLKNKAGKYVEPSIAATTAALAASTQEIQKDVRSSVTDAPGEASYPISALTYIILYKTQEDANSGKALLDFLKWAMGDGQKFSAPLLYAPLPPEVMKMNEATLATLAVK